MSDFTNRKDWRPTTGTDAPPLRKMLAAHTVRPKTLDGVEVFEFIASTTAVDREGDTIDGEGWEIENYLKNPVVLWGHNHSSKPIGRAVALTAAPTALKVAVEFTPHDINPEGDAVRKLVEAGYLKAVSVGFIPREWTETETGYNFTRTELLEISVVPIPANQEALIAAGLGASNRAELVKAVGSLADAAHRAGGEVVLELVDDDDDTGVEIIDDDDDTVEVW